MATLEKQAWIVLVIVLVVLAAYFSLTSHGWRLDSVSLAVFAIVGFLGFRPYRRRSAKAIYDERDRQIERNALFMSLCIFYVLAIIFSVVVGIIGGWDAAVPIRMAVQIFWIFSLIMWGLKALLIIVQYRRGGHA